MNKMALNAQSMTNSTKAAGISNMTNFDPSEFKTIWGYFGDVIGRHYNSGRGKMCSETGKAVLFTTLAVRSYSGQWEFLARVSGEKGPTFERTINRFVDIIPDFAHDTLVKAMESFFSMTKLINEMQLFKTYKCAPYATDVTFQQTFRPSGSIVE